MSNFDLQGAGILQGGVQGFIQGMRDSEDRKFKQMEFDAKARADELQRERQAKMDEIASKDREFDNRAKVLSAGYKMPQLQEGQSISEFPLDQLEINAPLFKAKGQASGVKDDPMSTDLRTKWLNDPTTKNTREVSTAYDKIQKAAQDPSAAGDLSLIFSYMKVLDPGSTVREGEFANAQNAAGVPDQIRNMWNRARNGERLNPQQRGDMVKQAKHLYDAQLSQQEGLNKSFGALAQRRGLQPNDIVLSDMFVQPQGLMKTGRMSDGLLSPKSSPPAGKIRVSNGKETLLIDKRDLSDAMKDGFQEVK